jgi:hypothetical protein
MGGNTPSSRRNQASRPDDNASGPAERRTYPRRELELTSRVYFEPGNRTVECVIRNLSADGARIVLADPTILPTNVALFVEPGACRNARVRWRIGLEAGLQFTA